MRTRQRRERFKALLAGNRCVHPASVFDPLSARMAEDLGFEVGMLAGSVASMTVTGAPDLMGLTLPELVQQAYRICRAGDLSLLVDADDGYGNAINVMRTVEELEAAGVAALSIEDTSLEEGIGKMQAALAARSDPDLVIVGRTSAAEVTDLNDCIRRLAAYADAGVDAIFPVGLSTRQQLETLHAAIDLPLVVSADTDAMSDLDYLAAHGARLALQPHAPFGAAIKAVYDTLRALRDGVAPWELENVADSTLLRGLSRQASYERWLEEFSG